MSLIANVDFDELKPVLCQIEQVVLRNKGFKDNLHCEFAYPVSPTNFTCAVLEGDSPVCIASRDPKDKRMPLHDCMNTCNTDVLFNCHYDG